MPQVYISPHNKISYLFLSLTVLFILLFIFGVFGSFYGAQIVITPKTEEISIDSFIEIREENDQTEESLVLTGKIMENVQSGEEKGFPQATVSVEDYAEGEIILKNNNPSALNFISSTRFASPEGLIFRAVNRVYVAAKSETAVLVRADKMGEKYDIGPTQFTIPNLQDSTLKSNIIAESKEPMTGGLKKTGVVMQSDIDQTKTKLKETLYQNGLTAIKQEINDDNLKIVVQSNVLEEKTDAVAGEEKIEFTIQEKMKIGAVALQEDDIVEAAVEILKNNVPIGKDLVAYELKSLNYRLTEYDVEKKTARLEIQFRGYMAINEQYEPLAKTRFRGLNEEEVKNYLQELEEIEEVKIKFWPPLLFKTIPQSTDKIKVKINI